MSIFIIVRIKIIVLFSIIIINTINSHFTNWIFFEMIFVFQF